MNKVWLVFLFLPMTIGALGTLQSEENVCIILRFQADVYGATMDHISNKQIEDRMVFSEGMNTANKLARKFAENNVEELSRWRDENQLNIEEFIRLKKWCDDLKKDRVEKGDINLGAFDYTRRFNTAWSPLFTSRFAASQILRRIHGFEKGQLSNETMLARSLIEDNVHVVSAMIDDEIKSIIVAGSHIIKLDYKVIDNIWLDLYNIEIFKYELSADGDRQSPSEEP